MDHYPVIIIGGGQAGLSMSYCLKEKGVAHLVFEKRRMAEAWRSKRWDSFAWSRRTGNAHCLGSTTPGNDPKGFMVKEQIVEYIEAYARSFNPPLKEGVSVSRLRKHESGVYEVTTDIGVFTADQIVVATGGYQTAKVPRMAERFPSTITHLHSSDYKNADQLPPGDVLVVGTGPVGLPDRRGLASRRPQGASPCRRRTAHGSSLSWQGRGRVAARHGRTTTCRFDEHPKKDMVRAKANHYVTGRDGGRDIDLRKFATEGMSLDGRLKDVNGPDADLWRRFTA